jgi:hypothetical protein
MQNIVLNETENTPYVNFDFEKGFFELKGVSYPEYAKEFFQPIIDELAEYVKNPPVGKTQIFFKFTYFNTGTNSPITGILKELETAAQIPGHEVEVVWCYEEEDEDMRELGEYFKSLTSLPIEIQQVESF